ncbi:hypothetical protein [Lysobacter sp. Root983]|uniref:hypothetical protein n=1 Tax=Lysobacter sp. Root983 TaxID=1736613 RepID=UPI000709A487|nr:hypothetical protein [Lysobacter sp. Root983]KRD74617.1 hypothetical protein ASE43_15430 [Lysobacter sp. Root983]
MKRNTPDPLSPEERALADRLARLGPHDGPSPALDAKILAAAHAAATSSRPPQRTRRRWALSAIPGGLITGVGVAATMALAVGVVWQLRPISPSREAPIHEPADGAFTSAEMIARPRQTIAPPPPPAAPALPQANMSRPGPQASADAAAASVAAAPPLAASAAKPAAEAPAQAADGYTFYESDAPSPAAPSARRQRTDKGVAANAAAPADVAADAAGNMSGFYRAPDYAPPAPAAKPGQDSDPFSLSPSKARRAAEAAEQRRETEAKQETTLDRIEVTGSRIKRADIESAQDVAIALPPLREDARLERAEWLERIRARRDAGDVDDARASLKLFRKTYPRVRIPDDLRPLQR